MRRVMRAMCFVVVVWSACYRPEPPAGAPCANGVCPSGLRCVQDRCVVEGAPDSGSDTCLNPATCEGEELVDCTGRVTCTLGCVEGDPSHCLALVPSNGISPSLLDGATGSLVIDKLDFDTTNGRIKSENIEVRLPGEGVVSGIGFYVLDGMGVFTVTSAVIPEKGDWRADGDHTFVLYAATTIAVQGELDGGAFSAFGGAGGNPGGQSGSNPACRGGAGNAYAVGFGEGGGGGGGATMGGNGAPSNQPSFGIGGAVCTRPSTLPLRGGIGGGAGGFDTAGMLRGGAGGGGGGAIALVAMEGISIQGVIGVPGGGGDTKLNGDGGGGGGTGGAILIEAPFVQVSGALTANGGGGAGPSTNDGARGSFASANTAPGGTFNGKTGGRGGAGTTLPANGETYDDGLGTIKRGGGGGGAVGVIEVRAVVKSIDPTTVVSPPARTSTAVLQ